jgi:hypothetical protein
VAGYIFRQRRVFTLEELNALEGTYIEDLDPPAPVTGVGSGVTCLLAEFDDGPIEVLTEIDGGDLSRTFGRLGYSYGGVPSNNPCARRRGGELWNGNGFIYARFISAQRFLAVRVDTSVGEVAFNPLALISGGKGPFAMTVGDQLGITSSVGTASSTAIAAAEATQTGSGAVTASGFLGGERLSIQLDDGAAPIIVTFSAADQAAPAIVARINSAAGAVIASQAANTITLKGLVKGTSGKLVIAELTAGVLTALKLAGGSLAGSGTVGNLLIVTATEMATIINATAALNTNGAKARVTEEGLLAIYDQNAAGTINVTASAVATTLKITNTGVTVKAGENAGGVIRAGTRVRTAGGLEWVTMVSTTVAPGTNAAPNVGPFRIKVRPAFDDGTALGTGATTVNVLVDPPSFSAFSVVNPSALTVALTEPQIDAAYLRALDKTMDGRGPAVDINYLYSARKSYALDVSAVDKAEEASNNGFAGRKYIRSGGLGTTKAQAQADRALLASDRVFYTWPGWQVTIPEILTRGAAGGLGFRDDGIVTVRAAGTLAKINALLPPEENPGQATQLLTQFFAVEDLGYGLAASDYKDLKASGICSPRVDRTAGSVFQSGVTTDLTSGRQTQARRKMSDFIQDSLARASVPYSKKLMTEARADSLVGVVDGFLSGLLSRGDPQRQRIKDYSIDLSANTDATLDEGIYIIDTIVKTLSSFDAIVIRTEIGPGAVVVSEGTQAA